MCFSDYLLDKNAPGDDVSSRPSRRRRLATKALVIDFDNGEDRDLTTANPSRHKKRTGTPIYMARRVRGMVVAEGQYTFPAILQVTEKMARQYQRASFSTVWKISPQMIVKRSVSQKK